MALAERMMNARFGDDLVDHFTYVLASDGDLMEGISHEAISIAGHLKLARLIVLYDDNNITIDGSLIWPSPAMHWRVSRPQAGMRCVLTGTISKRLRMPLPPRKTATSRA